VDEHTQRPQVVQRPMSDHIVTNPNLDGASGGVGIGDPQLGGKSVSGHGHGGNAGGQGQGQGQGGGQGASK
jgi:hypothetical protein